VAWEISLLVRSAAFVLVRLEWVLVAAPCGCSGQLVTELIEEIKVMILIRFVVRHRGLV